MQTIDPIMPRRPLRPGHRLTPPVVSQRLQRPGRGRSIDGIKVAPVRPRPPSLQQPSARHEPPASQSFYRASVHPKTSGLKLPARRGPKGKHALITAGAAAILIGGSLVTQQPLGLALVILYGVIALVRRISSRTTFTLALIAFVVLLVSLLVIGGPKIISSTLAE